MITNKYCNLLPCPYHTFCVMEIKDKIIKACSCTSNINGNFYYFNNCPPYDENESLFLISNFELFLWREKIKEDLKCL